MTRPIMRPLSILVLLSLSSVVCLCQGPVDLHQAFKDLSSDAVLMDLSAHPDDEDGASLAYYRMKYGVKTYSVLFTRGEGGQNETGPELYEELGVLRSKETEAAGRILGAGVHFLNFKDFGFSKTATETFKIWGGQTEVLRRLVYMIRTLRPDVIFTNHNTIDGHGNHQAVAIAAIAAFDAAADPAMFPEQLKLPGVALWQPRKLFFRVFGRTETTWDVSNHIEDIDSARGVAYVDIATQALRMHRTQGLDRVNIRAFSRGRSLYKLVRQSSIYEQDTTSFFSGIDLWRDPGVAPLAPMHASMSTWHEGLDRRTLLGRMSDVRAQLDSIPDSVRQSALAGRMIARWQDDIRTLTDLLCGQRVTFRLKDTVIVAQQHVTCSLEVSAGECALSGVSCRFDLPPGWSINEAEGKAPEVSSRRVQREYTLIVGNDPEPTLPRAREQYRPLWQSQEVVAHVSEDLDGHRFSAVARPAFDVAPSQVLTVEPGTAGISLSRLSDGSMFTCTVKNYLPHKTAGRLRVLAPAGWRTDQGTFTIDAEDSSATMKIFVRPPLALAAGEYHLQFRTDLASEDVVVKVFDVRVAGGITVGVVRSYDNSIESALGTLGVSYSMVDDRDLSGGDLSRFSTIIIDIRAYLVRDSLRAHYDRILQYVRNGGHVVVMYQREREWKPEYAPFPFQISGRRVTMEDAPVEILRPADPLFTTPNRIGPGDWEGWVQERGLHFPSEVSDHYVRLVSTNDPDEPPLTTGYLLARDGRGSYLYTSLVWYRQLKEFNPGAFRCFANMISYPAYRK